MKNYKRKQVEFETEQCLTYVTMSTINVYKKIVKLTFTQEVANELLAKA